MSITWNDESVSIRDDMRYCTNIAFKEFIYIFIHRKR